MDAGQQPGERRNPAWPRPPKSRTGPVSQVIADIGLGGIFNFLGLAILYGIQQTITAIGLIVICTAGVGLVVIIFVSWLSGWTVRAVWRALRSRPPAASPS